MKFRPAYGVLLVCTLMFIFESWTMNSLQGEAASLNAQLTSSGYIIGGVEVIVGGGKAWDGDIWEGLAGLFDGLHRIVDTNDENSQIQEKLSEIDYDYRSAAGGRSTYGWIFVITCGYLAINGQKRSGTIKTVN